MVLKLIDTHAHLQFPQFDKDREAVITRTKEAGIGVINVGTDLDTSQAAAVLAETNDNMWATVGIHPTDLPPTDEEEKVFAELRALAVHPKVVGIGECGLELRGEKREVRNKKRQIEIFERQIDLARTLGKPLMVHCREAYDELFNLLTLFKKSAGEKLYGNIHFFAGDWPTAKRFLDLGFTLSFTGVITFARDYDEVIKNAPLERILVETDCPFVAPIPYRGRRNEPIYVVEVVKRMAGLRQQPINQVAEVTLTNAKRLFAL